MKKLFLIIIVVLLAGIGFYFQQNNLPAIENQELTTTQDSQENQGGPAEKPHPLSIETLRGGEYPGSEITIEQTLTPGSNYKRYIASYKSEGLKIFALLTVPNGTPPEGGWPAIVFNHGYIPPAQYRTTERYIAYTDGFSRNGYVLIRPDYRGHGNSEGNASGGYGSNDYTVDVLNALASIKKYPSVNPENIGMWGHSMGGHITLRSMVTSKEIKAGVIWAGVVASYPDMLTIWRRSNPTTPFPTNSARGGWRQSLTAQFGTPETNPTFWNSISSTSYLTDISGPLQLHHGTADHSVPHVFSETLHALMKQAGKESELYIYPGDEHDIPNNFGIAMTRSISFFDKYLKP